MNRVARDALAGGRSGNAPAGSSLLVQQRRIRALAGGGSGREDAGDEVLDLFSKSRRSVSVSAAEEPGGQNAPPSMGRISVGQARLTRTGMDDLLSAAETGKHDYDWLLTPPGTPLVSTLETGEAQLLSVTRRTNTSSRSVSTTKASRLSVTQPETKNPMRPARSSSATRPSISSYSSSQLSSSIRTSALNTSTASISSRPLTPGSRSSSSSCARHAGPAISSRSAPSRCSTPAKIRPAASSSSYLGDKSRPLHGSRPSTPSSRPHPPATSISNQGSIPSVGPCSNSRPSTPSSRPHAPVSSSANQGSTPSVGPRSNSRPSTPTRRVPTQSPAPATSRSPSAGRGAAASSRQASTATRPSSPGPRVRSPAQPLVLPDFPLAAPPNLRTKIPERPASAGRARAGLAGTSRSSAHVEAQPSARTARRQSVSPVTTRGRIPENSPKLRLPSDGQGMGIPEAHKPTPREAAATKNVKTNATAESTGFGRTISKKSLDMALRHMDIRQSTGGVRGASLFPQSIRSASAKVSPARILDPGGRIPACGNGTDSDSNSCTGTIHSGCNGAPSDNGDFGLTSPDSLTLAGRRRRSEPDVVCESSRYDPILLREDARSMNWLHSIDGRPDQSPVFDLRFEALPEPFVLL